MTPAALAKHLFATYEQYKLHYLTPATCKHEPILLELLELVSRSKKRLSMQELGTSLEGRSINLITAGRGSKHVLLWSQMHGDEPTATLALMDMINFLVHHQEEKWVNEMLSDITIYCIPMLNPDGAERVERRTAAGIDMNRDAIALVTPEARILRDAHRRLKPVFGFNLHDQELSSVGNSKEVTAIALLAPALDEKKTKPIGRLRAMRVGALLSRALGHFAEGHLATYDDTFEPRAFGDSMQLWGTSTILIESGHWPNDRDKHFIRKLNFVAILSALRSVANGSYQDVDLDYYTNLKPNTKWMFDILIKDIMLDHGNGQSHSADIGLTIDPLLNKNSPSVVVTIKDLGDLRTYAGLENIGGSKRRISSSELRVGASLPFHELLDRLQMYHPHS